jgi:hypothetical protein
LIRFAFSADLRAQLFFILPMAETRSNCINCEVDASIFIFHFDPLTYAIYYARKILPESLSCLLHLCSMRTLGKQSRNGRHYPQTSIY